jgi:soluble lytic murein transglycosylase
MMPPMKWLRGLILMGVLAAATLACNSPAALGVGPTATPTASATPTDTPTPTPSPTPAPAAWLEQADWSLFIGDWSAAMDAYQTAKASATDTEDQVRAQLGVATVHLRAGRPDDARAAFSDFLNSYPEHPLRAQAYFLRALAYQQLDQTEAAIQDYGRYLEARPGYLDSYVLEKLGDLEWSAGRPQLAVQRFQQAADAPRLGGTLVLQVKIGRALYDLDDYEGALAQFNAVHQAATDAPTLATANYLAGLTLEAMGDPQAAYQRYLDSVEQYPDAYDAYSGLIRLVEAGVPVDLFLRGYIDFQAGAYEPALRAFNRAELENPSGDLYYYRGLTLRALGNASGARADFNEVVTLYPNSAHWSDAYLEKAVTEWVYLDLAAEAVSTYRSFVAAAPTHPDAAEALLDAGRVAERNDDLPTADALWQQLVEEYPSAPLAFQAAFDSGIVRYRQGDADAASQAFAVAETAAASNEDRSAARFWIGKLEQARGNSQAAAEAWTQAAAQDPTGFYSARASDLLQGRKPFESVGVFSLDEGRQVARAEAEDWLRATFVIDGPEPLSALDDRLATDPRLIRGQEFWRMGLFGLAKEEFESLREDIAGDAEETYRLMHKLLELRLYQPAIFAARNILDLAGMDDAGTLQAPRYFNLIRFGIYYGDLILPAAKDNGFDALFVLSVVRQESLFEGFATSYAAARGLMQVIPSTGADIANQLGWPPGYQADDLYRPVVSVRFGVYYLAQQRDRFDGDLVATLAAYNAGPGNALSWKDIAPDDPDLFLEIMRIEQPQEYVRSIFEVYHIYQDLYVQP